MNERYKNGNNLTKRENMNEKYIRTTGLNIMGCILIHEAVEKVSVQKL